MFLLEYFSSKDNRTKQVELNSIIMLIAKGVSMFIQLLLVPLTIGYVSSATYGIWLTLSSVVAWVALFDIGINNGLKNRYAECKAKGDIIKAQKYVSTTYFLLSIIFLPLLLILLIINAFINWSNLLNIPEIDNIQLSTSLLIVYFCLNFIFSTVNIVLTAEMKPAIPSILALIQQVMIYIIIWLLTCFTEGNLLKLCIALTIPPLIIIILSNVYVFRAKLESVKPKFSCIDLKLSKSILSIGYKFFIIQIAVVVLFQTSNFVMIKYYGADEVTQYNIAYKYFFILNTIFSILISPLWVAVTDSKAKGDYQWIQRTIAKYFRLSVVFMVIGLFMLIICNWIYGIWIGDEIGNIPFMMSFVVLMYAVENNSANLFAVILNGAGYLKLQFIFCIISPFIFVMICYFFIKVIRLDAYCIPLAIFLSNIYGLIISPIQTYLVFFKGKQGIWTS